MIMAAVKNMDYKEAFKRFRDPLFKQLPADQEEFIKLLEEKGVIGMETIKKMKVKNQGKSHRAAAILGEIHKSVSENFGKLLSAMEEYNRGLETLAKEIRNHLDPGTYLLVYSIRT